MTKNRYLFIFTIFILHFISTNTASAIVILDPQDSVNLKNRKAPELPTHIMADGLTISLSTSSVKQGDAFWIEVELEDTDPRVQVWTEIDEIQTLLFPRNNSKGKLVLAGLVGVPFSEKPGILDLKVMARGENIRKAALAKIQVTVSHPDRQAELLDVAEYSIVPTSDRMATRIIEDDREIDQIFDIRSWDRKWDKQIRLPFEGDYRLSSPFGKSRIYSSRVQRRVHWGVDYALPVGTPLSASLDGKVVMAKEFGFMGKTIVIDHGFGLMTLYAHLKEIGVVVGQRVIQSQVIGKSGNSGKCTGPLVHWQVITSGVKVDPLSVLRVMKQHV